MLCIFAEIKYKSSLAVKLKSFHLSRLHGSVAKSFTHNGQSIVHHLNQRATVSGTASAHVCLTLRKQLWCHWCHINCPRLMVFTAFMQVVICMGDRCQHGDGNWIKNLACLTSSCAHLRLVCYHLMISIYY